jgi:FkbM family methyltransferase
MGIAVHRARHGLICHEEQDDTIGASLRTYGEWAEEEIYFLSAFVPAQAVVLDVGANVGTHTLAFSRCAGARGLVIAIDAQERMHELLVLNVALNAVENVRCIRAIAGRETGVRFVAPECHQARTNFGAVSYLDSSTKGDRAKGLVPLSMITVDDLSLEGCDLMKIDVEGMELDVLLGAVETIARHRPPIYFEQAREERFAETFEFFERFQYSLFWHVPDPFNRNNLRRCSESIFGGTREVNVVAIPQEKMERWQRQTSQLPPVAGPRYDPPSRQGSIIGWALPDAAYDYLASAGVSPLATLVAETITPS